MGMYKMCMLNLSLILLFSGQQTHVILLPTIHLTVSLASPVHRQHHHLKLPLPISLRFDVISQHLAVFFVAFQCAVLGRVWCLVVLIPGLEVIKLEFILRLKIKYNDWLLADTCPQAANPCALF